MNILRMSNMDKEIIRLCGKSSKERYETYGTSLKKIVVRWLEENGYEVENLKYSLVWLSVNGKKILCTISTCTVDRSNKNYTIGIETADKYMETADKYPERNSWVALFAEIDGDSIKGLRVIDKDGVNEIAKEYPRKNGNGTYFACSFNAVNDKSMGFDAWVKAV